MSMDTSHLRQLAHLILDSLDQIDNVIAHNTVPGTGTGGGGTVPSLDTPVATAAELRAYAAIQAPATVIKACCGQLAASVAPSAVLADAYWGYILSACLKVVGAINVAEILREAGPQGLHVREVCQPSGTDPHKIARVLRLLASHHIFREVTPDVFTNNRLSSLLDSGSSVHDLFAIPPRKRSDKFLAPGGAFPAHVEFMVDDMFTAATKLTECLTGPKTARSAEPTHAPVNLAFATALPVMAWQQLPEHELRRTRFDVAMSVSASLEGPLRGFDWAQMKPGSKIVDVGGGLGSLFLKLAREQTHLTYIVQDQPTVLPSAISFWKEANPEALASGRIQFQAIDFFTPQPLPDATLFVLRQIIHDWSDPYAARILRNLRAAAQPATRLVIIDIEVPMACPAPAPDSAGNDGGMIPRRGFPAWVTAAPPPLLPNYGTGRLRPYFLDLLMLLFNNGQERTMAGYQRLLREAGWALDAVYYIPESANLQIVARPLVENGVHPRD